MHREMDVPNSDVVDPRFASETAGGLSLLDYVPRQAPLSRATDCEGSRPLHRERVVVTVPDIGKRLSRSLAVVLAASENVPPARTRAATKAVAPKVAMVAELAEAAKPAVVASALEGVTDFAPRLSAGEPCRACGVLKAQTLRAWNRVEEAGKELEREESCRREAEEALRAARASVEELERQCHFLEMRRGVAREEMEERRAAQRKAASNWEDEVVAWSALCGDLKKAALESRVRATERLQRGLAVRETATLQERLHAAREEVARLHAMQSSLEAQRLQDGECAEREARVQRAAAADAHAQARLGGEASEAAAAELAATREEEATLRATLHQRRVQHENLKRQAQAAQHDLDEVRRECREERRCCQELVTNLRNVKSHSSSGEGCAKRTCSPRRLSQPVSVDSVGGVNFDLPAPEFAELAKQVEALRGQQRYLAAENQLLRSARQEESRKCRETVERLRGKIHRYRAGCTELQRQLVDGSGHGERCAVSA